jgi:trk system potassium uptake protein TrkH
MEKLVHPNSIGGSGTQARRLRREGAYVAWIFFMLFGLAVILVMALLTLTGIAFEPALVFSVAALSTTGPLATVATETPLSYAALGVDAKVILAGAMVLGRLETLAIIALLAPDSWRN